MQNNKQHADFIRGLKQRPRQGQGGLSDFTQAWSALTNIVNSTAAAIQTATEQIAGNIRDQLQTSVQALTDTNATYLTGLEKRLALDRLVSDNLIDLSKRARYFEERNKSLNKTFGVSIINAAELSQKLSKSAGLYNLSSKQAIQYASSINNVIPSLSILNQAEGERYGGLQAVQKVLVTNMGLEAKAAEEFTYYATQRGKNAAVQLNATKEMANAMDIALGTQNSFLVITEEIGKSSASTQLQFGRMGGSLELAAIKGRNLGLTLDQVSSIGNKMLNIESSIGDELEYQLLSGRRLIGGENARADLKGKSLTNAFREAALMGDANKQADALNAILEQEGETLTNNVMARQQMAKLLGMEENQLARALQKKKLLEEMGADEKLFELGGKDFQAALSTLKASGKASADQIKQAMDLADTRSTEDLIREQVDINEDMKLSSFLLNDQVNELGDLSRELLKITRNQATPDISTNRAEAEKTGGLQLTLDRYNKLASVINDIKAAKLEDGGTADDFLAINGKLVKYRKDDLVIGGTFGGRRQEVINQVTSGASGGGGVGMNPDQFAQAFVRAVRDYGKFEITVSDVAAMFGNT